MGPKGKIGLFSDNWVNRKQPPIAISPNYEKVLNTFKEFVKMNLMNSGINSDLTGSVTFQ